MLLQGLTNRGHFVNVAREYIVWNIHGNPGRFLACSVVGDCRYSCILSISHTPTFILSRLPYNPVETRHDMCLGDCFEFLFNSFIC